VSYEFNRAGVKKLGYNPEQVNTFLEFAKTQYANPDGEHISAASIRITRFRLVKNGYSISAVDSAMEKLEDVFAARELERTLHKIGLADFKAELFAGQELLANRIARKPKKRFRRRAFLYRGYSLKQVDEFCSQVETHIDQSTALTVKAVRLIAFRTQRGGYAEYQVDAFIEKLVEVLQRESILAKTTY